MSLKTGHLRTGYQDGPKIQRLRKERDLSVQDLADQVGIQAQSMRNVELGRGTSVGLLFKIAAALNVELADIVQDGKPGSGDGSGERGSAA